MNESVDPGEERGKKEKERASEWAEHVCFVSVRVYKCRISKRVDLYVLCIDIHRLSCRVSRLIGRTNPNTYIVSQVLSHRLITSLTYIIQ